MTRHQRRWMRLLRLVIACLAFFVVEPAHACDPGLGVTTVLVAPATAEAAHEREERQTERSPAAHRAPPPPQPEPLPPPRALRSLQSPRALVDRKYVRHCSLLC